MEPKVVALVNPRNPLALYGGYRWQPLSLACVAAAVPAGWRVEFIDEQFEGARTYDSVEADQARQDQLRAENRIVQAARLQRIDAGVEVPAVGGDAELEAEDVPGGR